MAQNPPRPSMASEMFMCLDVAPEVIERFKRKRQREPTDAEMRLAASMFIELQKSGGRRPVFRPRPRSDVPEDAALAGV